MVLHASCHCGAIEYEYTGDSQQFGTVLCHCKTCRIITSSASLNVSGEYANLKVTKGEPKIYTDNTTHSGKPAKRGFCGNCGTTLYTAPTSDPKTVYLKVGALKNAEQIQPAADIYVEDALPGTKFGDTPKVKVFEGMMKKEVTA